MPFPFLRIGLPILLAASAAAVAQPAPLPAQRAGASAPSSEPSASSAYRSAFADYRPFAEQPLTPWRQANDAVAQIGGWQAYAREGQGKQSDAASATGKQMMPGMKMPGMKMPAPAAAASPGSAPATRKTP